MMKRLASPLSIILLLAFPQMALAQTPSAETLTPSQFQENSPRPKREGAIIGRVIGPDGRPMAGAQINAYRISEKFGSNVSAVSDEDGAFRLTGLLSGTYTVNAYAPGHVSADIPRESNLHRVGENLTLNLVKGGEITGRVTDETGEPLVGVSVGSQRLRDSEGKRLGSEFAGTYNASTVTDDRGIYRLYGLKPGVYVIWVSSERDYGVDEALIRYDAPTYYPSAVRETATEINVRSGEEIAGVDIRHRGERGHIVSGILSGDTGSQAPFNTSYIWLRGIENTEYEMTTSAYGVRGFVFEGVPDGEYELSAMAGGEENETFSAAPRRISVKGADVLGVELKLSPHGSIAGRVLIESSNPPKKCPIEDAAPGVQPPGKTQDQPGPQRNVEEILLRAERDDPGRRAPKSPFGWFDAYGRAPNEKGEFALKGLEAGRYRVAVNLPDDDWYLREARQVGGVGQPAQTRSSGVGVAKPTEVAGAQKRPADASRNGVAIKAGEKISGLEMVVADGAAALLGRVASAKDGTKLPSSLRAHLIPAEAASADDVVRYAEVEVRADGSFEFKHIAPGKYWLLARPNAETELTTGISRPTAWDATERTKLRREAAAAKNEVELQPCGRVKDFVLRFNP
jgi:protocatechuate 3,4-dioxygenase beta subunit